MIAFGPWKQKCSHRWIKSFSGGRRDSYYYCRFAVIPADSAFDNYIIVKQIHETWAWQIVIDGQVVKSGRAKTVDKARAKAEKMAGQRGYRLLEETHINML